MSKLVRERNCIVSRKKKKTTLTSESVHLNDGWIIVW